jgi:4-amino-4-deoxy-L-arabinose transferase-like glycosyltransferase
MDSQRQLPLRQIADTVARVQKPTEEIVMVGFKKPTVVFYSQRPVTYFKLNKSGKEYLQQQKSQPPKTQSFLLISQPEKFPQMGLKSNDYQVIEKKGAYQLARVRLQSE